MPRVARSDFNTTFFHVITQGINKSYIFENANDIKYYIKNMYELLTEYKLKIIAYCIMNNHAHILIETKKIENLSKYMHRLNTKYALFYNKKYNRVGYVFRDRYKSEGIYNEKHLYNCIKYIYDNPVKAGICKFAWEYPFSNYKKTKEIEDKNYNFLEVETEKEIAEEFISKVLKEKEFLKNENILKEIIKELKDKYNMSLREIAKQLNINREKVRNLYNEKSRHKNLK